MKTVVCCLLVLAFSLGAAGQAKKAPSDWESKPLDQWDDKDVSYLLDGSPWSKTIQSKNVVSLNPVLPGSVITEGGIRFRLQSSLIVRLAILRKRQLSENYASMDAKAKAEFNRRYKAAFECSLCEKYYIVALQGDSRLLSNAGQVKARAENIYLSNEKGERRTLERYSPQTSPGSEALFFFPRNNDKGEPLLKPDNETLIFNFRRDNDDEAIVQMFERVYINIRDIVREGKVIF